jgi:hypothetical protein
MHTLRRAALPLALLLIAGCAKIRPITAPSPTSGAANFSTIVAMGTSITAGSQSGGLSQRHQVFAFPYLFAQQAGSPFFRYPAVNLGGWPPLLHILNLGPPLVIDTLGAPRGAWINPVGPYNNMGVPGALLADVMNVGLNYDPFLGRDVTFFNNILQQGQQTIPLSLLQLVSSLSPTFITFEYGANEILGPAASGSSNVQPPAPVWAGLLHQTLDSLDFYNPTAKKVIFNVPNVTSIPFFNTLPIVELNAAGGVAVGIAGPKFLIGPGGTNLAPGDLVCLTAGPLLAGIPNVTGSPDSGAYGYAIGDTSYLSGYPVLGNGRPLPDAVVLSPAEQATLAAAVADYNAAINTEAQARGYGVLDLNGLLAQFAANGFHFAGNTYTTQFVTGGLFSLDGVHPTDLGHGIICNQLIDLVNAKWGAHVPTLNLNQCMTPSSSSLAQARNGGLTMKPVSWTALERATYIAP